MEEIEKGKMSRVKQVIEAEIKTQVMTALTGNTIRDIVRLSNELMIAKSDIISLLKENGQFVLVYYK